MGQLNQSQQAMLIWPVLLLAAQMQRVLTYGELEGFTGIEAIGQGKALGMIHDWCKHKHYPILNSIVVEGHGAGVGFPGPGFPEQWTLEQHLAERARVFAFNWSTKDKPRSEDFVGAKSA